MEQKGSFGFALHEAPAHQRVLIDLTVTIFEEQSPVSIEPNLHRPFCPDGLRDLQIEIYIVLPRFTSRCGLASLCSFPEAPSPG